MISKIEIFVIKTKVNLGQGTSYLNLQCALLLVTYQNNTNFIKSIIILKTFHSLCRKSVFLLLTGTWTFYLALSRKGFHKHKTNPMAVNLTRCRLKWLISPQYSGRFRFVPFGIPFLYISQYLKPPPPYTMGISPQSGFEKPSNSAASMEKATPSSAKLILVASSVNSVINGSSS